MALSEMAVRQAKPAAREYKLADGGGLYVLVRPNGSRLWALAYRFAGKQKKLSIGPYPRVGLAEARERREAAKRQIGEGIDPSRQKRLDKIAHVAETRNTFALIAKEWLERRESEGANPRTIQKQKWLLDLAGQTLGTLPITGITPQEVYEVLKRVEKSGRLETANRLRSTISSVFRHAIVSARATADPTTALARATLPPKVTHHAAVTKPKAVGGLVRAIRSYDGSMATRYAIEIVMLTFVRSQELRSATWAEIDFDKALWNIPVGHMKMKRPHIVPLARQTLKALRDLKEARLGGDFLFPSVRTGLRPISENTVNAALRRMGYGRDEMTCHGFRTMASTLLNENNWSADWVERQLAHEDQNKMRRAYNAAQHLEGRTKMMQWYADTLDRLAVDEDDLIG